MQEIFPLLSLVCYKRVATNKSFHLRLTPIFLLSVGSSLNLLKFLAWLDDFPKR